MKGKIKVGLIIMALLLLILSFFSINCVYASPVHLEKFNITLKSNVTNETLLVIWYWNATYKNLTIITPVHTTCYWYADKPKRTCYQDFTLINNFKDFKLKGTHLTKLARFQYPDRVNLSEGILHTQIGSIKVKNIANYLNTHDLILKKNKTYNFSFEFEYPVGKGEEWNLTFIHEDGNDIAIDPTISGCSVISSSGTYNLTSDIINSSSSECIDINANDVIFNCQGHKIDGEDSYQYGITILRSEEQTTNVTIRDCIITDWYIAIELSNADENNITNVTANSNEYGLYFSTSDSNTILNTTTNSNTQIGIYFDSSNSNTVSNSTTNSNLYGLAFTNSNSNTISNITANSNSNYGITIYSNSDNNTIANSTITNNTDTGLYLDEEGSNDPENNTIYNCFFNNTVNVKIDDGISGENYFNTTKQTGTRIYSNGNYIGGNYYTNSTGNGYSDTCTDSNCDGFCDNSLNLSNGTSIAYDYLPLSNKYSKVCLVTLNSPPNQTLTNDNTPDFNFTVSGNENHYSCKLFINDSCYGEGGYLAWDIATFILDSSSFSTQSSGPRGIFFNPNGTKMYELGSSPSMIYQYSCSEAWNISSCSYTNNLSLEDSAPYDLYIKPDGLKVYFTGDTTKLLYQYNCSEAWNISSCSYEKNISSQSNPVGIFFKSDGTKMYEVTDVGDKIYEYDCSTAWDLSSCVYNNKYLNVGGYTAMPRSVFFKSDGLKMYFPDFTDNHKIYQFSCSNAWDITSCSYEKQIVSPDSSPQDIIFKSDGTKMYIVTDNTNKIWQYYLLVPNNTLTTITANSSLSDGTYNWYINCSAGEDTKQSEVREITIETTPPIINWLKLIVDNLGENNLIFLIINAYDLHIDTAKFNTITNSSWSNNQTTLDISDLLSQSGTVYVNDSATNLDSYPLNYTLTNNSYSQNTSFSNNLSEQRIYKSDTLYNYADKNLTYNITHYNKFSGTLLTGGTFSGELSNNSNTNLYSEWSRDWLNETYSLPTLATDSVVKVNTYQIYNFTLNISRTIDFNFTNVCVNFSNYYNTTIYSNLTSNNITQNFTSTNTNLLLQLNASTVVQKSPSEINCPTDYTKGDYSGYGYCKLVTGTEDIREVYYIMWINVKDNSSRNYEINYSMPFISEDLSDLISLNYTINNSDTDLSFSTSSKTLVIGKSHSTSSLSEGEYQVKVDFSYLYTGGTTGGGGSGGSSYTAICGNGVCEIGETPENCPLDCENATFELNVEHLTLIGFPGSEVKCLGLERGCALKITNPSEKKIHIRVEIESNDESKNWVSLSLDEENWAQILDFDIVGKSSKWVYFDIRVPEGVETEKDYMSNLRFVSLNCARSFPISIYVKEKTIFSLEYYILLLDSTIIHLPRSNFDVKAWHILFILLLTLILLVPYLQGRGMGDKIIKEIEKR